MKTIPLSKLAILACLTVPLVSQAHDLYHEFGVQHRYYSDPAKRANQSQHYSAMSINSFYSHADGEQQWVAEAWLRLDGKDSDRNNFDLREAYWLKYGDVDELKIGIARVFWGVTESAHLVDVINQTDLLEGLDGEDKLGQPMVQYTRLFDSSQLELFVLPYFREQSFYGGKSRFALPSYIQTDQVLYASSAKEHHTDLAIRYSHMWDALDWTVSVFEGTNRDAQFVPQSMGAQVYYAQSTQVGSTLQYLSGGWAFKAEAIWQKRHNDNRLNLDSDENTALVAGFEYTQVGVFDSAYDLGYIAEYQKDTRDKSQVIGQSDLFVGARLALNDANSSEFIAGVLHDLDDHSYSVRVEGSMRITEQVKLELAAYHFSAKEDNFIQQFDDNDLIELNLFWYYSH